MVKTEPSFNPRAEPSFGLHQDLLDVAAGLKVAITEVTNSVTGSSVAIPLGGFQVQLTYDIKCMTILALRELDFPIIAETIDNSSGSAKFNGFDSGGRVAPVDLGLVLTRLVGSYQKPCNPDMEIEALTDVGGMPVAVVPPRLSRTLLRGDARADGAINLADPVLIGQYLAGLRPACTNDIDNNCLHSVNAASVRQDGAFDKTNSVVKNRGKTMNIV
jgi:hypothetical protein